MVSFRAPIGTVVSLPNGRTPWLINGGYCTNYWIKFLASFKQPKQCTIIRESLKITIDLIDSGRITIFHQPGFHWDKGISLPKSYREVAIIWPDWFALIESPQNLDLLKVVGKSSKHILPNGGFMVMNPMVESAKNPLRHHPFCENTFQPKVENHQKRNKRNHQISPLKAGYSINIHFIRCIWGWFLRLPPLSLWKMDPV